VARLAPLPDVPSFLRKLPVSSSWARAADEATGSSAPPAAGSSAGPGAPPTARPLIGPLAPEAGSLPDTRALIEQITAFCLQAVSARHYPSLRLVESKP